VREERERGGRREGAPKGARQRGEEKKKGKEIGETGSEREQARDGQKEWERKVTDRDMEEMRRWIESGERGRQSENERGIERERWRERWTERGKRKEECIGWVDVVSISGWMPSDMVGGGLLNAKANEGHHGPAWQTDEFPGG